jgi:hypothetical protein
VRAAKSGTGRLGRQVESVQLATSAFHDPWLPLIFILIGCAQLRLGSRMISLDKYVIFESITVIMISLGIIYGQLVPILHKDFLSAHLGCQRFNFLMRKSKLLQSFANDLKYTLGDHRVAGIIEEVASIIENVHVLTKVLLLTIDVKTASVQILAEETHEED